MGKWSDDQMFKFVGLYGYHSCLWDTTAPAYKSKECRQVALTAIVDDMNIPGFGTSECKIKIKNMRSHYCQELRKVKDGRGSYKPTLLWYDAVDSYLRDFVQQDRCHHSSNKVCKFFPNINHSEHMAKSFAFHMHFSHFGHHVPFLCLPITLISRT